MCMPPNSQLPFPPLCGPTLFIQILSDSKRFITQDKSWTERVDYTERFQISGNLLNPLQTLPLFIFYKLCVKLEENVFLKFMRKKPRLKMNTSQIANRKL